jgi:hypothetical protein
MADEFYAEGVRFSCTRCSACCRGEPGYVFLARGDIARLLARLGLDFKSFFHDYCSLVDEGNGMALSLREVKRENGSNDCVLWGAEGCKVYEDRPIQCSTYPFWSSIMESRASWQREARACPGIDSGKMISKAYIEERLLERRRAGTIVLSYGVDPECSDEDSILGSEGLGADPAHAVEG